MSTLILGSRPDPTIPNLPLRSIVFVNGSVAAVPTVPPHVVVYHVFSDYVFTPSPSAKAVQAVIRNRRADQVLVINAAPEGSLTTSLSELAFEYRCITTVTRKQRQAMTACVLGWRHVLRVWRADRSLASKGSMLKDLLLQREIGRARVSTGIFAL